MQANDILNSLNIIAEKLFKSIEGQVYKILDDIICITPDILKEEPIKNIFTNKVNGIIIIANALIIFFVIHYMIKQLISMYNGQKIENTYFAISRLIIVCIFVNNSYFICEQILGLFSNLSDAVNMFGKEVCKQEVSFVNLKETILSIDGFMKSDLISVDGIIKGIISFGIVSILISFSVRYVTVIFLVIISPLAIMCASSNFTKGIFNSWSKMFVINMLIQIVAKLVLIMPLAYKKVDSIMYKIILVGSIYTLYKIINFSKELFMKISEESGYKDVI